MKKNSYGFTLVELIVVITILVILASIAFLSLQGYLSSARDSVRVADISNMSKGLELYKSKTANYPLVSTGVTIYLSGTTTIAGYQSDIDKTFLSLVKFQGTGADPLDEKPYVYYFDSLNKQVQVMALLEQNNIPGITQSIDQAYAAQAQRFPLSRGSLDDCTAGILLGSGTSSTLPLQQFFGNNHFYLEPTVNGTLMGGNYNMFPNSYCKMDTITQFVIDTAPCKQAHPVTKVCNPTIGNTISAAGEAIEYLSYIHKFANFSPNDKTKIKAKITDLGDYILGQQFTSDNTKDWYGAFPASSGSTYYYTIDGSFGGKGLLDAYHITNDSRFLTGATLVPIFLRKMQTSAYNYGRSGYMEYTNGAYLNNMYTKNLLGLDFLSDLYVTTNTALYNTMRTELHNGLIDGFNNRSEYFMPTSFGNGAWHGVADGLGGEPYVFADSIAYAIKGLLAYGDSGNAQTVYNSIQGKSVGSYNTQFSWAGYLLAATGDKDFQPTAYYDLVNAGILRDYRAKYDPAAFWYSRNKIKELGSDTLYWGLDFSYKSIPDPGAQWFDVVTASNLGKLLY